MKGKSPWCPFVTYHMYGADWFGFQNFCSPGWYNGSVCHIDWPYQVYIGQWPIFYGPAILLNILKTIWWRNIVLGIMDQCDSKIDLVKYMWVNDLYFMVHWFNLISLSDLNYFYTLRNGTGWGYSCPSGHLCSYCKKIMQRKFNTSIIANGTS